MTLHSLILQEADIYGRRPRLAAMELWRWLDIRTQLFPAQLRETQLMYMNEGSWPLSTLRGREHSKIMRKTDSLPVWAVRTFYSHEKYVIYVNVCEACWREYKLNKLFMTSAPTWGFKPSRGANEIRVNISNTQTDLTVLGHYESDLSSLWNLVQHHLEKNKSHLSP